MKKVFLLLLLLLVSGAAYSYYNWENGQEHNDAIVLYGNVDVRQVDLGFRVAGLIEEMKVDEGDEVKAGQLVGWLDKKLYQDQVREALANVEAIKANLKNSEKLYARRQQLISSGSISQEDLEDSEANRNVLLAQYEQARSALNVAQDNLNYTEVFAPKEGFVLTRIREPGSVVKAGDPIYTVSIKSPVWIRAYMSEPHLGQIYPGMKADVSTDSGKKTYQGHIGFISPVAEFTPKTVETTALRTDLVYRLRVIVDDPDLYLRQGMPVTVRLLP